MVADVAVTSNPFAGVGDVFFNYSTQFSPAFSIAELFGHETLNLTVLYLITALELAFAICFFGQSLRLPRSAIYSRHGYCRPCRFPCCITKGRCSTGFPF